MNLLKRKLILFALALVIICACCRIPDQIKSIHIQDFSGDDPRICSAYTDLYEREPMRLERQSGRTLVEAEEIRLSGRILSAVSSIRAGHAGRAGRFAGYAYLIILQFFISMLAAFVWLVCRSYQKFCPFSEELIQFIHSQDGKK